MKKIEASPALVQARKRLEDLNQQRLRIGAALEKAKGDLAVANSELDTARARLADAEADAALTEGLDTGKTRRTVLQARDAVDVTESRVAGLNTRETALASEIAVAEADVKQAEREWSQALATEFIETEFKPAIGYFVTVLQAANAVALATNHRMLASVVRQVVIPDLEDTRMNAAGLYRWPVNEDAERLKSEIGAVLVPAVSNPVEFEA